MVAQQSPITPDAGRGQTADIASATPYRRRLIRCLHRFASKRVLSRQVPQLLPFVSFMVVLSLIIIVQRGDIQDGVAIGFPSPDGIPAELLLSRRIEWFTLAGLRLGISLAILCGLVILIWDPPSRSRFQDRERRRWAGGLRDLPGGFRTS